MERDTKLVEISFLKQAYSFDEADLLKQYADILPNLLVTFNFPLEHTAAQYEHIRIVDDCLKAGLLDEICGIRDQFRKALGDDNLA